MALLKCFNKSLVLIPKIKLKFSVFRLIVNNLKKNINITFMKNIINCQNNSLYFFHKKYFLNPCLKHLLNFANKNEKKKKKKVLSGISKGIWKLWAFGVNGEQ